LPHFGQVAYILFIFIKSQLYNRNEDLKGFCIALPLSKISTPATRLLQIGSSTAPNLLQVGFSAGLVLL